MRHLAIEIADLAPGTQVLAPAGMATPEEAVITATVTGGRIAAVLLETGLGLAALRIEAAGGSLAVGHEIVPEGAPYPEVIFAPRTTPYTVAAEDLAQASREIARAAGGGQHQRHGVLGRAVDVGGGGVDDQHTARGRGVDVDVVETDAGAGDDLQPRGSGQHLGVDGGGRPHQQGVGVHHRGEELLPVGAVDPADIHLVTQGFHRRGGQLVGYQYHRQTHEASA